MRTHSYGTIPFLSSLLLASVAISAFGVTYVSENGSGDLSGSDWENTKPYVTAVNGAAADEELWLKAGTYTPKTYVANANAITIRGGFAGTETLASERTQIASVLDAHLKSTTGRWTADGWVKDGEQSPCIDAGTKGLGYKAEPRPNGHRRNLGAYGNTSEASMSAPRGAAIILR